MKNTETNDIQHFHKLIKEIQYCMFTTESSTDGALQGRPMTLQKHEGDGVLWFFAGRSTKVVEDIAEQPRVNLAFNDPKENTYISASGQAEMVMDKAKAEELWNPILKAWFPKGVDDPELCLIKVMVESADYWDSPDSKVVQLVGFAKAILTGKKLKDDEAGKRGHLNIN